MEANVRTKAGSKSHRDTSVLRQIHDANKRILELFGSTQTILEGKVFAPKKCGLSLVVLDLKGALSLKTVPQTSLGV